MKSGKLLVIAIVLAQTLTALAQITRPTSDQAPPVPGTGQHHIGSLNESVNPATGAASIRIDAGVPPARGITVPFAFGYDSNAAQHIVGGLGLADNASYLGQGGWSYVVPTLTEWQSTFQVSSNTDQALATQTPLDPQFYIPCPLDSNCMGGSGGLSCDTFICPPVIPPVTTNAPVNCTYYDHFNFFDMNGNAHDLGITSQNNTQECTHAPGAPVTVLTGGDALVLGNASYPTGPPPAATVVDSQGRFYSFSNVNVPNSVHTFGAPQLFTFFGWAMLPAFIEDRNGNRVVFTDHGNGAFDVTDTLGRTAISTSGFGTSGNTVSIVGLANPYTLTWSQLSTSWVTQASFQVIAPNVQSVPPTKCSAGPGMVTWNNFSLQFPLRGVSQIELPNGQTYQFQYDPIYGVVNKLIYPNGGYVRYVWGLNLQSNKTLVPSSEPLASSGSVPLPCEIISDTPAVMKRFVSFDGQTEVEEQDFSYETTWAQMNRIENQTYQDWTSKQTTVTTKDLVTGANYQTIYTYVPAFNSSLPTKLEGAGGFFPTDPAEQTVQYFDGNGKRLRRIDKAYIGAQTPPIIETTTLDNGLVSQVRNCYAGEQDSPCIPLPPGSPVALGNLLNDHFEYDFGSGAHGPLLRHTRIDYQMFQSPLFPNVFANQFGNPTTYLGVPQDEIIYDGQSNRIAETDYAYDQTAVGSVSAVAHDDTTYGAAAGVPRVNMTTATAKCFIASTSCPDAITTYTFDETGQVLSKKDPLGNITSYSYQDSFYDPTPPGNAPTPTGNTNAYLTQITHPTTNGVHHVESSSYAFADGVLTIAKDENGNQTNYQYNDALRRLTETDLPDGGQTKIAYNDSGSSPNVVTTTKVTGATSLVTTSVMDGLGHTVQQQINSDPAGLDFTDITYDGLGRVLTTSNPHRSSSSSTDGTTQNQYDALGRITQVTMQDGSTRQVSYPSNCTISKDEAGNPREACSDALGRLIEVDEPRPGVSQSITASSATATVTISGSLQSKQLNNPATGTVTIIGTDSIVPGTNAYDFGTVTVYVGTSGSASTTYGNLGASPSSASDVATALCSAINSTQSTSTLVQCTGTTGGDINLAAQAAGSAGNGIALSVIAQTQDPQSNQSAFSASTTSGSLSGGGATLYDSATTTITIDGLGHTVSWSGSGTTPGSIALSLAAAVNSDPNAYVSGSASGNTVTLTANIIGEEGNDISIGCSTGYDSADFSAPSFSISCPSALSGGQEAGGLSAPMVTLYNYDALGNLLQVTQQGGTTDQTQWRMRTFTYDSLSRLVNATNPESGTISYAYDPNGNVVLKTSPQQNQSSATASTYITYCYDALNRVLAKGYALSPNSPQQCSKTSPYLPNPAVVDTYDAGTNGIGHLTSLTDQAGSGTYTYEVMGRIKTERRTIAGISKTMGYTYYLDGSINKLTYPSNAVITYTPESSGSNTSGRTGMVQDLNNNINYVLGPAGSGTSATYTPDGSVTGFLTGKSTSFAGITNSFSYNSRVQPVSMSAATPSQTVFSIGYDFHPGNGTAGSGADNGNVYSLLNNRDHTRDQTFTYDTLNRLISAQNAGTDCSVTLPDTNSKFWGNSYSYDAWGNLLAKNITKCGSETLSVVAQTNNQLVGFGYDAAGNMNSAPIPTGGQATSIFDAENRMTTANFGGAITNYTYDADGNRVEKSNGTTGTLYWYMTPGVVAESDLKGNLKSEYILFNGERIARKDFPSKAVSYYFSDHLKTTDIVTDALGNIKNESDYYPWGGELQFLANDSNHYKFTGKERDNETGLDYFGARYYSNQLGRFVTPDWAAKPVAAPYAVLGDPQTLNLYTYVRNIPTVLIDTDGHLGDEGGGFFDAAKQWLKELFSPASSSKNTDPVTDNSPPVLPLDTTTHEIVTTTTRQFNQYLEVQNEVLAPLDPTGMTAIADATVHQDKTGLALAAAGPVLEAGKLLGPIEKTAVIAAKTAQADTLYPKLAGKVHDHHVIPIYLGGAKNGETVSVPASYHQLITNEFRKAAPYGQSKLNPSEVIKLAVEIYLRFPLP